MAHETSPNPAHMLPGEPFNPWRGACGFYPPDVVGRQRDLTDGEKRLFEKLCRRAGRDALCFPSFESLSDDLGKSPRQVKRDMLALERFGLIRHVRRGRRLSNRYEFLWHPMFQGEVTSTSHHSRSEVTPTALHEVGEVTDSSGEVTSMARGEVTSTSLEFSTREFSTGESSRESLRGTEEPTAPKEGRLDNPLIDYPDAERNAVKRHIEAFGLGEPDAALIESVLKAGQGFHGYRVAAYLYDRQKFVEQFPQHRPKGMGWFVKTVTEYFRREVEAGGVRPQDIQGALAIVPNAAQASGARMLPRPARGFTTGEFRRTASGGP